MSAGRIARLVGLAATYVSVVVVMVFPIYWLVITSLKPERMTQTRPPVFLTHEMSLGAYQQLLANPDMRHFFVNSLSVALLSTVTAVLVGCLAAYSLSKSHLSYRIRRGLLLWILLTRIFPPIVIAIPYFTIMRSLGLADTVVGLSITHVAITLPFVVWLMLGFFQEVPAELDRAAMLDGCSMWRRFWQVNLPLVLPGIAVTSIFAFIISWNEFLFASILTSFNAQTLPVAISTFIGERRLEWTTMAALGTLMLIPVMIFALAAQRYIVRGLTFGAVKE
jgi:multiple sugar transport system permease protein